ncbi:hypothetical protein HELRODRAFT_183443 [Helobdella robusta]|uniref:THAP-type domain-containing protein n=1 Tax=Helobdella robusta TaxID=6412 RepID=T1FJN8_HELRO|nr:hypothetical protein HELRODRAFT_183443 [Helobdella robusta]ESO11202.1 hypothetical protein HELRODRAFT_183443 [Helobdella robusta]
MTKKSDVSFPVYPLKNTDLRARWVRANPRKDYFPNKYSIICSLHSDQTDFVTCFSDWYKGKLNRTVGIATIRLVLDIERADKATEEFLKTDFLNNCGLNDLKQRLFEECTFPSNFELMDNFLIIYKIEIKNNFPLQEREKRKKNIIIYGVPESSVPNPTDKRTEDEAKTKEIMKMIDKVDIKVAYSRRLRSKDTTKPGPLLVDLTDASLRNPVLLAAKKLRDVEEFKSV